MKSIVFYLALIPCTIFLQTTKSLEPFATEIPWYAKLPACPCSLEDLSRTEINIGEGGGKWVICGAADQKYHYGATKEVRWIPKKKGDPGQQCTYDKSGRLITGGIASGTPDMVSPQACDFGFQSLVNVKSILRHVNEDVNTWKELACANYLRKWPPNNAGRCVDNVITPVSHISMLATKLTCEEIVALFALVDEKAQEAKRMSALHDTVSNNPSLKIREELESLLTTLNCDRKKSEKCLLVAKALRSL